MQGISYEDFSYFENIVQEVSIKNVYERVLLLSIAYFTLATELRFLEIENYNKNDNNEILTTIGYKESEILHLTSI
jgi:hypothetical protein